MSEFVFHSVMTVSFWVGECIIFVGTIGIVRPHWDSLENVALDFEDGRFGWGGRVRIATSMVIGFLALVFGIGAAARALS